jgi:hypothetical protein
VVTLPAGEGTNALFVAKMVDRRRNLETARGLNIVMLMDGCDRFGLTNASVKLVSNVVDNGRRFMMVEL